MDEDIKIYNRGDRVQLSDHFASTEFDCKCHDPGCVKTPISLLTVQLLEQIRLETGSPIHITSGYRCVIYNKKIGGVINSQHLLGKAADIVSRTHSPRQVQSIALKVLNRIMGKDSGAYGRYSSFTHIDSRAKRATWKG